MASIFKASSGPLVDSGRYNSAGEVLRDGLRLLEDREKLRAIEIAELRQLAEEGRLSGLLDEPGDVTLERLRRRLLARVAASESSWNSVSPGVLTSISITRDNPNRALTFVAEIRAHCHRLLRFPEAASLRPGFGDGVRVSVFRRCLVLSVVHEDLLEIRRVVHGARGLTNLS